VVLGLLFVASVPFTKLRHLVLGPLNILLRSRRKEGALTFIEDIEEAEILGVGQVAEFSPQHLLSFSACVRCGRCEEACPAANSGMPVSPCVLIDSLRTASTNAFFPGNGDKPGELLGTAVAEEAIWACTTCGTCLHGCPAFVNPVDEIVDFRRYQVLTTGGAPAAVGSVLRNLEQQGNPWGMPAAERTAWARGLGVRELAAGDETDVLLFLGCAFAFDDRNQQVARAFVRLLQAADVEFGILGLEEGCCGETARRLGHEYLFQVFAEQNIQALAQVSFNRIITQCPHCFNTLRNEYAQLGVEYDVQHYTHFLQEIAPRLQRRLPPEGDAPGRLTYHDPCYLGRYNDTYAEPRQLLDTVTKLRVEMPRHRADSFCCGGGGGQMWLETEAETRINLRRLEEAQSVQADAVATSCPYCLLMFDDAIRSQGAGDQIQVMDIAELWARQLAPDEGKSSLEEST
jgi:Fe-S oxidoreductase